MDYINKAQKFLDQALSLKQSLVSQFTGEIVQIYETYPYLLTVILIFVPLLFVGLLYLLRGLLNFVANGKYSHFLENRYASYFTNLLLWYASYLLFDSTYSSLKADFRFYEHLQFILANSITYAFFTINVIKIFLLNAYDQFRSALKGFSDDTYATLNKFQYYTSFYLILYFSVSLGLENKSYSLWVLVIALIHHTKLLSQLDDQGRAIHAYLFGDLPEKLSQLLFGPLRLINILTIVIAALVYRLVFALSNFELTKKLAAKIIRQQVERVSDASPASDCQIPDFYESPYKELEFKHFQPRWFKKATQDISELIDHWQEDRTNESFLHIIGNPGSGRQILIDVIKDKYASSLNPLVVQIDHKITSQDEFKNFIRKTSSELATAQGHQLIIFSDAENLFLNIPGGYEALKEMFRSINDNDNNFFWINVFDFYSWQHIQDFFGHVHHRQKFIVDQFAEFEIRELILSKNKIHNIKINFEKAIHEATSRKGIQGREDNASTHFFRMLWEQSNGNPALAQELWLKSIKQFNEKERKIKVGLPERTKTSVFKDNSIDDFFVYQSLIKHSRLNFEECCQATRLSPRIVRFALNLGESHKFIKEDQSGRYHITHTWYPALVQVLKSRNLIYE